MERLDLLPAIIRNEQVSKTESKLREKRILRDDYSSDDPYNERYG